MSIETIFYFLGSLFFLMSISILAVILFFTLKIMRKAVSIEMEIKDTITEAKNTIGELKNKVAAFSISIAGITTLLEKLIEFKYRAQKRKNENQEKPPKKDKKNKKFASDAF